MGNFKQDFIARRSSCFKKEEGGDKKTQEEIRKLPSAKEKKEDKPRTQEEIRKLPDTKAVAKKKAYQRALANCKANGGCEDGKLNGVTLEEYMNG